MENKQKTVTKTNIKRGFWAIMTLITYPLFLLGAITGMMLSFMKLFYLTIQGMILFSNKEKLQQQIREQYQLSLEISKNETLLIRKYHKSILELLLKIELSDYPSQHISTSYSFPRRNERLEVVKTLSPL